MINLMFILEFVLALGLMIFIHELGHYLACRLVKVQVEEFGFGFPPRLTRMFRLGGTDFTLNWIPFGGFVRPKGENDPNAPGGMAAASPWKRLIVLFAGAVMNLVLGIVIFAFIFLRTGVQQSNIVQIKYVNEDSPALAAGVLQGDIVVSVNGISIDSTEKLSGIVASNRGKEISVKLTRNGQPIELKMTPRENPPSGQGPLGIQMGYPVRPVTFIEAIPTAVVTAYEQVAMYITLPIKLIQGSLPREQIQVVGPVGMYRIFEEARNMDSEIAATSQGPATPVITLWLVATLSIWLGFVNLWPIPAVDGGRILLTLPEIILKRRIPPEKENIINFVGFALLIGLMLVITGKDIINLIWPAQ